MNAAINDAHNLGWKVAHVLKGLAKPFLIDTVGVPSSSPNYYNLRFPSTKQREESMPRISLLSTKDMHRSSPERLSQDQRKKGSLTRSSLREFPIYQSGQKAHFIIAVPIKVMGALQVVSASSTPTECSLIEDIKAFVPVLKLANGYPSRG